MAEIVNLENIIVATDKARRSNQKIVLAGGCFDILHIGHIKFLEAAKKMGDILIILLEDDEKVKRLKGIKRPFFSQKERADMLCSLQLVDYVIPLQKMRDDKDYEELILEIKPDIIVATSGDSLLKRKKIQAKMAGGKLEVIPYVSSPSTSKLAKLLGVD